MEGFFLIVMLALYFVPTFVALAGEKQNATAIIILNIFMGWTLIGWVLALVWAAVKDPPKPPVARADSDEEFTANL